MIGRDRHPGINTGRSDERAGKKTDSENSSCLTDFQSETSVKVSPTQEVTVITERNGLTRSTGMIDSKYSGLTRSAITNTQIYSLCHFLVIETETTTREKEVWPTAKKRQRPPNITGLLLKEERVVSQQQTAKTITTIQRKPFETPVKLNVVKTTGKILQRPQELHRFCDKSSNQKNFLAAHKFKLKSLETESRTRDREMPGQITFSA